MEQGGHIKFTRTILPPSMPIPEERRAATPDSQNKEVLVGLLHEKFLRVCRMDPNAFIAYTGEYGNRDWKGQGEIHKRWQSVLSNHPRILLVCPREHGKTTQVILRVLWEMGVNPNLRVKLVCQGDDVATKRLIAIIDHIENNPRVQEVFPDLVPMDKGVWTKSKIYVRRTGVGSTDPSIEACGILSTATGGRADLLVFDDPVDFRNAIQQPSLRNVVKEAYDNVWMNLLSQSGRVWYAATPWHKDDLTHRHLASPEYFRITDSIDDDFNSIWPEQWPTARLRARFVEIGSRAFDRAFRNRALSDEDTLYSERLLESCYAEGLEFGKLPADWVKEQVRYFVGVDIAAGKSQTSGCYSVIFVLAYWKGKRVPISIVKGRWSSPALASNLIETCKTWMPELVFVESNNVQEALIQWVRQMVGDEGHDPLPIRPYFTGGQKMDPSIGLPGIAVEMENGAWIIPNPKPHGVGCKCGLCDWLKEMGEYPIGKLSDTVMACWFAREALRSSNISAPRIFSVFEEKEEEMGEVIDEGDDGADLDGDLSEAVMHGGMFR